MASLQIRTGAIRLEIFDDFNESRGFFVFNPEDVQQAQKAVELAEQLDVINNDFQKRAKECVTPQEQISLLCEIVDAFEKLIDDCFGEGTSQLVFGDAKSLGMFYDFFEGVMPYYEKASENRMAKYKDVKKKK